MFSEAARILAKQLPRITDVEELIFNSLIENQARLLLPWCLGDGRQPVQ